jgi:nicotinamide mononucleotide transporter
VDWLAALVAPLNHVLFHVGDDGVSWAELLGFLTGAACVALTVRRHIANFPVGIANSAFFLVLFASARLWADSGIQVVYIVLGFVGWWQWRHGGVARAALVIGRASLTTLTLLGVGVVLGTVGLTALLRSAHDIAPFWDALTTSLSLAAQWLLNAKKIENWLWWIAADCIYVPLYFVKHLDLTGIVYVAFLVMSITGLRGWRAVERGHRAEASTTVPSTVAVSIG